MTTTVITVKPDQTAKDCMFLMTNNPIRHQPVIGGNPVVGVISIGDVVKSIMSEQEFIIENTSSTT
jgi:CBS domain-containing protein